MMTRVDIYAAINAERERQHAKWNRIHDWGFGDCSSDLVEDPVKAAVLSEEVGEASKEFVELALMSLMAYRSGMFSQAVLDRKRDTARDEVIQVAAVAVAILEGM